MADAANNQGEQDPSMEEILQSIRRIIAEDDKDVQDSKKARQQTQKVDKQNTAKEISNTGNQDFGTDVLELTEMVQEDGSVVPVGDGSEDQPEPMDVLENIDNVLSEQELDEVIPASREADDEPDAEAAEPAEEQETMSEEEDAERLISDNAASASSASFKKLARTRKKEESPLISSPGFRSGATVEDLVMESLRPLLKEWLDANLPTIVERIVDREVKKLSRDE